MKPKLQLIKLTSMLINFPALFDYLSFSENIYL